MLIARRISTIYLLLKERKIVLELLLLVIDKQSLTNQVGSSIHSRVSKEYWYRRGVELPVVQIYFYVENVLASNGLYMQYYYLDLPSR